MSKGSVSISITGGSANIGAVSQGDGNRIVSGEQTINAAQERAFAECLRVLDDRSKERPQDRDAVEALKADLAELQAAARHGKPSRWGSLVDGAKALYERYGWAADPLKKLFAVLIPSGIAALT